MLALSVFSILLRWFETSMLWIDPLVRHLVFLSAFLGGVLATGKGTHIGIDVLGRYFESAHHEALLKNLKRIIGLTSFGTLIWLVYASYEFMLIELKYGKISFLGLHSGVLVGIIPVGFLLMAIRFFNIFLQSFSNEEEG
jgi:TRAP-type C4-dicarboxylate transport system permease small subunit